MAVRNREDRPRQWGCKEDIVRSGPFGRRQRIFTARCPLLEAARPQRNKWAEANGEVKAFTLNMRRIKTKALKSHAGPLDLRAVLRERQTAWRVPELTGLLSLGDHTLYDAIAYGQLPASRIGSTLRISPIDALAWYEARTTSKEERPALVDDRALGRNAVTHDL